jgi:hypothetical protein
VSRSARLLVAWLLLLLATPAPGAPAVVVRRLPQHALEPQAAVDSQGTIHLIYFANDPLHGDIFYVRSSDAGEHFTRPMRVNSQSDSALVIGGVRGPQLTLGKGARLHVAWNGSDKAIPRSPISGPPMLYTRLNDAADAFEPQRNLMTRSGQLDGGGSVAADNSGHVYVAWHGSSDRNDDTEASRRVWLAWSHDDGKTFEAEATPNEVPAIGACACCGLHLFIGPDGKPRALVRSAREMVHRDMYLLRFGVPTAFRKLSEWSVGKCVMSTAASAGDWIAWESNDRILFASLNDMSAPRPIGRDTPKHPAIAVASDGRFLIVWTEKTAWNKGGALAWQVFDTGGQPLDGAAGRADDLPAWDTPAAVALPDGRFVIFY